MESWLGVVCEICGDYEVGTIPVWTFLLSRVANGLAGRDDLSVLLSKAGSSLTVKVLLDALQQTTEFELSMAKKWATSVRLDLLVQSLRD